MTDSTGTGIYEALAAVMADVDHVGKDGFNSVQRFNFRGIDDVLNAVGPALRRHKVVPLPRVLTATYGRETTSNDKQVTTVRLEVEYRFIAPDGSSVAASVAAESFDSGDKATAKAMSVAMRTALIQVLALPTCQPDPDEYVYTIGPADGAAAPPPNPKFEAMNRALGEWQRKQYGGGPELRAAFTAWDEHHAQIDAADVATIDAFTEAVKVGDVTPVEAVA